LIGIFPYFSGGNLKMMNPISTDDLVSEKENEFQNEVLIVKFKSDGKGTIN